MFRKIHETIANPTVPGWNTFHFSASFSGVIRFGTFYFSTINYIFFRQPPRIQNKKKTKYKTKWPVFKFWNEILRRLERHTRRLQMPIKTPLKLSNFDLSSSSNWVDSRAAHETNWTIRPENRKNKNKKKITGVKLFAIDFSQLKKEEEKYTIVFDSSKSRKV